MTDSLEASGAVNEAYMRINCQTRPPHRMSRHMSDPPAERIEDDRPLHLDHANGRNFDALGARVAICGSRPDIAERAILPDSLNHPHNTFGNRDRDTAAHLWTARSYLPRRQDRRLCPRDRAATARSNGSVAMCTSVRLLRFSDIGSPFLHFNKCKAPTRRSEVRTRPDASMGCGPRPRDAPSRRDYLRSPTSHLAGARGSPGGDRSRRLSNLARWYLDVSRAAGQKGYTAPRATTSRCLRRVHSFRRLGLLTRRRHGRFDLLQGFTTRIRNAQRHRRDVEIFSAITSTAAAIARGVAWLVKPAVATSASAHGQSRALLPGLAVGIAARLAPNGVVAPAPYGLRRDAPARDRIGERGLLFAGRRRRSDFLKGRLSRHVRPLPLCPAASARPSLAEQTPRSHL